MMTYELSASWINYRELLASEAGVRIAHEPSEERLIIRGHHVHLDVWTPSGLARGTIILVHGGGGNGRVLAPFADALATRGWRVLAPDLPGFGLTEWGPDARPDYREWPAIIAELADAQDAPCGLAGFSVGGMTAVFAAQQARRRLPVVATTLLDVSNPTLFRRAARWPLVGSLSLLGFRIMPAITDALRLPLAIAAPLAKMSALPGLTRYFRTDSLLGRKRVSIRFFRTLHQYVSDHAHRQVPVLLAHPGQDAWTPAQWSLDWLANSGLQETESVVTTTGSHLPVEPESFGTIVAEADRFFGEHCRGVAPDEDVPAS